MKRETFLHKLTNWLAALGFAAVCGCMAVVNKQVKKADAYTVQKAQQSVTFSKEELNLCNYDYLFDYGLDQLQTSYIIYNNMTYNYKEYDIDNDYYIWQTTQIQDGMIAFGQANPEGANASWYIYVPEDEDFYNQSFDYGLTIYSSYFAEEMQKSITLSANQLNNNTYEYFSEQLTDYYVNENLGYIIYNNKVFICEGYSRDYLIYTYTLNDDYNESIILDTESNMWTYNVYDNQGTEEIDEDRPFIYSITIYSTYIADNLYAPFTDGEDIIGGITSGLGLISYIATAFLNGFTGLFWQNNTLTNFAMYSLIMLGIAITFSIIKLVLNILRSNTGA